MKLVSSNETKLKEFQRILPMMEILKGLDLPEVEGSSDQVIIYKSLAAGKGTVVEDTILIIEGEEVIDIKWKMDELKNLPVGNTIKASWQVMLGYNTGTHIEMYKGVVNGIIIPDSTDTGYGFDPYFLPDGSDITLGKLEQEGNKDNFSARRNALIKLKKGFTYRDERIFNIPVWTGKYQNDISIPDSCTVIDSFKNNSNCTIKIG